MRAKQRPGSVYAMKVLKKNTVRAAVCPVACLLPTHVTGRMAATWQLSTQARSTEPLLWQVVERGQLEHTMAERAARTPVAHSINLQCGTDLT